MRCLDASSAVRVGWAWLVTLLDPGQVVNDLRREGGGKEIYRNCGDHMLSTSSARANASNSRVCPLRDEQPTSGRPLRLDLRLNNEQLIRGMTGQAQDRLGTMPSTRWPARRAPRRTGEQPGITTCGPSGIGSLKNISTITRT